MYSCIMKKLTIGGDISVGTNKQFTNYIDRRFKNDHYHLITKKETVFGAGITFGYFVRQNVELYAGLNSNRGPGIGVRFWFLQF